MGNPKEKPRSIQSARKDFCRQILSMNEDEMSPEEAGKWVHEQMQQQYGDTYPEELAMDDCVKDVIKVQESGWNTARQGEDLLGDTYLEANVKDVDGKLRKVKLTTSDFHDAEREKQITNLRRVNKSFERDEERREILKSAGMWEVKGMTTGQAAWKTRS